MRKVVFSVFAILALASCSSDALVSNQGAGCTDSGSPIAFTVNKRNITRGDENVTVQNLESTQHYNFGVWAYKTRTDASQLVMSNYLVGYSNGSNLGYDKSNATTWASGAGSESDHTSPWFYEKLGNTEYGYTGNAGFYKVGQTDFMSANANQYLRYWDLAYTNTNFYAYAPYHASGVEFKDEIKTLTVVPSANTAAYNDPTLHEFIYAGAQATNSELKDVKLQFKHLGAQVKLQFFEEIPGYTVKLVDESADVKGVQATPATLTVSTGSPATKTYTKVDYYTSCGANISFSTPGSPSITNLDYTDAATTKDNLVFDVPEGVIPAKVSTGTQTYAKSGTVYYATPQPSDKLGFTFHVSYELEAEDNHEKITVHDARVFVPASMIQWEPNKRYIYNFKFTVNSTGTTNPQGDIDFNNPTVPEKSNVYPIVFDGATIEEYTDVNKEIDL